MARPTQPLFLGYILVAILVAGCARSGGGSPAPGPLALATVIDALRSAGITVANVADNLDPRGGPWRCLSGSFRLTRVDQQRPAAVARPGDRPSVDILLFTGATERAAAQASIGADGQVHGVAGCGTMVDWVATPHVVGVANVLLFVATDDAATVAALTAAASRLGG